MEDFYWDPPFFGRLKGPRSSPVSAQPPQPPQMGSMHCPVALVTRMQPSLTLAIPCVQCPLPCLLSLTSAVFFAQIHSSYMLQPDASETRELAKVTQPLVFLHLTLH